MYSAQNVKPTSAPQMAGNNLAQEISFDLVKPLGEGSIKIAEVKTTIALEGSDNFLSYYPKMNASAQEYVNSNFNQ